MTNPYAATLGETKVSARRSLAFYSAVALATVTTVAFGVDAVRTITWFFRTGESTALPGLLMPCAFLAASLLFVFSEWVTKPKLSQVATLVLAALVAYTMYAAFQIATSYDIIVDQLRGQPSMAIGLAWFPATWIYAGFVAFRIFRSTTKSSAG
jgi:riboflavin transporter FmnP